MCSSDLEIRIQTVEPLFPDASVVLDPVARGFQRLRLKPADALLCPLFAGDQFGGLEHAQVPGDRWQGYVEWLGQFADRSFSKGQSGQDGATGGIGKGGEGVIEAFHLTI